LILAGKLWMNSGQMALTWWCEVLSLVGGSKWFFPHRFLGKAVLSGWAVIPQNEWHVALVLFENHHHFAHYCSDRGWPAELSTAVDLGAGDRTMVGAWSWWGVKRRARRNYLSINHSGSVLIGGVRFLINQED